MTKLTKREQETIIIWNKTNDPVSISTYDEALARKFINAGYGPTKKMTFAQGIDGYEFEIPKEVLTVGIKKHVFLSDEDKMKVAARLKAGREKKKES